MVMTDYMINSVLLWHRRLSMYAREVVYAKFILKE